MKNWLIIFLSILCVGQIWANPFHRFHDDAERDYSPEYLKLADGDLGTLKNQPHRTRYFWPVKVLSIGHTNASYQRYSFVNSAYFHHGIDIRADAGSDVIASAGGQVINIENYMPGDDAYWEVAILDENGFIWQYHHINRQSIPESLFEAYQNKTNIPAGTKIGEVYFWGVTTFGEQFHHVHLNILGKNKTYLNPFEFLELLPDNSAPEIVNIFLVKNGNLLAGNQISTGIYSVGAEVKDLILSNVFVVPPNEIIVSIDGNKPLTVWKFDKLPGGADEEAFVNRFYLPELACGDYNCRKPIFDLGFRKQRPDYPMFPTKLGNHSIEVLVRDYNGNEAKRSFNWLVTD